MPEQGPQEYPFPEDFDFTDFGENAKAIARHAVDVPGFIGLGEAASSEGEVDYEALRQEMAPHGINVALMVLNRLDGGQAFIPVFIDQAIYEGAVADHMERAKTIVANSEVFADMDAIQKALEIANLARALADGGGESVVYRIGEKGEELITYPQQEMEDSGETG